MRGVYRADEPSEQAVELAKKLTALIVDSAVSFQDALCALDAAEDILLQSTRPVRT